MYCTTEVTGGGGPGQAPGGPGVPYRLATQASVLATMVVDGGETLVVACVQSPVQPPALCVTTLTGLLLALCDTLTLKSVTERHTSRIESGESNQVIR